MKKTPFTHYKTRIYLCTFRQHIGENTNPIFIRVLARTANEAKVTSVMALTYNYPRNVYTNCELVKVKWEREPKPENENQ